MLPSNRSMCMYELGFSLFYMNHLHSDWDESQRARVNSLITKFKELYDEESKAYHEFWANPENAKRHEEESEMFKSSPLDIEWELKWARFLIEIRDEIENMC